MIVPSRSEASILDGNNPSLLFEELFLVQEYFGSDISKMISDRCNYTLQEDHVVTIVFNILCSLNFVHSAKVLHRDIKPANILINN